MAIIAPSILTADFARLGEELRAVSEAPWLHLDVMDGHFVPDLTFGPVVVRACGRVFPGSIEVHLMTETPRHFLELFDPARVARVYMHIEALGQEVLPAIEEGRRRGFAVGLALNPATPLDRVMPYLGVLDAVLVMTVEAGRGGQPFQPEPLEKVRRLKALAFTGCIAVDGGMNVHTAKYAVEAGAELLVAGSSVFDGGDPQANYLRLQRALAP